MREKKRMTERKKKIKIKERQKEIYKLRKK